MEEEADEDALGYLMLLPPAPPWLFDLLVGVTPLLQVGLSAPVKWRGMENRKKQTKKTFSHFFYSFILV